MRSPHPPTRPHRSIFLLDACNVTVEPIDPIPSTPSIPSSSPPDCIDVFVSALSASCTATSPLQICCGALSGVGESCLETVADSLASNSTIIDAL